MFLGVLIFEAPNREIEVSSQRAYFPTSKCLLAKLSDTQQKAWPISNDHDCSGRQFGTKTYSKFSKPGSTAFPAATYAIGSMASFWLNGYQHF